MSEPALPLDYAAPDRPPVSRWPSAVLLTLSAVAVGYAIHIRDGEYTGPAVAWVGVAIVLCLAAILCPPMPERGWWRSRAVLIALAAGVAFQLLLVVTSHPSGSNYWSDDISDATTADMRVFDLGAVAMLLLAVPLLSDSPGRRWTFLALVLATQFLLGVWMIRASPNPDIDVFVFQQQSSAALLRGDNPYTISFPDIYAARGDKPVYGPGISEGGQLNFGFPYTPLSLYLATIGYAVAGDHRYAQLAAMTLAGALLACARPGRTAALAAVMLLFTPRAFFILGRAWTEPFVVLGLALTVFFACRRSQSKWVERAVPVALGLFLATKQYLIFAPLAAWLLLPRPLRWRSSLAFAAVALLTAVAVTAPLALRDLNAFIYSAFTVQKVSPFREDALSFLVLWYHKTGTRPGVAFAFAGALIAAAVALWRAPRNASGFAAALALIYLPFIALNKQAFANYYFFVIGALCAAVAAWERDEPPPPSTAGRHAPSV